MRRRRRRRRREKQKREKNIYKYIFIYKEENKKGREGTPEAGFGLIVLI